MHTGRLSLWSFFGLGLAPICILGQAMLTAPHPSWDLHNMRPPNFLLRNGGLDFLSDGRLVASDWGSDMTVTGKVYIISGMGGKDSSGVTYKVFAQSLKEPLGLKVVNDTIYVMCKDGLYMLPDADKNGLADENRKIVSGWSYPLNSSNGERWHLFAFGLLYKDGFFYGTLASEYPPSSDQGKDRGSLIKMDPKKGTFEIVVGGLRTPNGIAFGPEGEIFGTDNQGHWLPANKLNHFVKGRNYGMHNDPANPYDISRVPQSPPVVWLEEGQIGLSPSQPAYVTHGPYSGQFLVGDVSFGGLQRIFVEKVAGEYQGVVFKFAGGFEAGTNRLVWGPDGALYIGQIGNNSTNWGWQNKNYGLSKLIDNSTSTFELLAVRSRKNGMELEFTEPVSAASAVAANFTVETWTQLPQEGYGAGNLQSRRNLTVSSATLSMDKKSVFLQIDGLTPNYVVHIKTPSIRSATAKAPWASEAWYTLNKISPTSAFDPTVFIDPKLRSMDAMSTDFKVHRDQTGIIAEIPFLGNSTIAVQDLQGRTLATGITMHPGSIRFSTEGFSRGTYFVRVLVDGHRYSHSINLM